MDVNEITLRIRPARMLFDEFRIVSIRHEADILAVVFFRVDKAMRFRDGTRLTLRHAAERKLCVCKLLLRQGIKHVALILARVDRFLQQVATGCFILYDLCIMSGNHIIHSKLLCPLVQIFEFQIPVTVDAGIRRDTTFVAVHELVHDLLLEMLLEVHDIVIHPHRMCHRTGILHVV